MSIQAANPRVKTLRVVMKVRTDDLRWKVAAFEDHRDYHGALATARRWHRVDEIEKGFAQVTMCVHEWAVKRR